ncbi:MAG TPA: hypothetical protein VN154_04230 [Rhizomicrobium sp.]|nr:hypothetical protein [Rhizomicrobium sp.]
MTKLSEQLADLSVRAKHAEDAASAAQNEAHDKIVARREQARAAAAAAVQKVDKNIKSASDSVRAANDEAKKKWTAFQTKVDGDLNSIKADIAEKKFERAVKRADKHADELEWEAEVAIDYAVAAIEQAELAVLDAVAGRKQAIDARLG